MCRDPLDFSEARGRLTCSEASRARLRLAGLLDRQFRFSTVCADCPGSTRARDADSVGLNHGHPVPHTRAAQLCQHVPATVPKEQLACAEVGLDPNEDVFGACVQGLESVKWAPFFDDTTGTDPAGESWLRCRGPSFRNPYRTLLRKHPS